MVKYIVYICFPPVKAGFCYVVVTHIGDLLVLPQYEYIGIYMHSYVSS